MLNYKVDIMDNNIKNSFKTYSKKLWLNFDEATIISPNLNGEKEKGITEKSEYEIEKKNLVEFVNSHSISINTLLLQV